MTATALRAAVECVVSAFSAALHAAGKGQPEFAAFQRLLRKSLSPKERDAIEAAVEKRLVAEIEAEIMQRRLEKCWPHRLRRTVLN